jgi:hypothetical protein
MGPFNVTFNDFFWVAVAFFLIPPAVKISFQILIQAAGWFSMMEQRFKDNPIEARLLRATRPIERLLRRQK